MLILNTQTLQTYGAESKSFIVTETLDINIATALVCVYQIVLLRVFFTYKKLYEVLVLWVFFFNDIGSISKYKTTFHQRMSLQ